MTAFIYGGLALSIGMVCLAALTPRTVGEELGSEIIATQESNDPHFKKMNEISGIALAGFVDEAGSPLLWGHEERTSRLVLMRAARAGSLYVGEITLPGKKTRDAEDIAVVHSGGKGTIYLEDAGSNRKDMPACVRYARNADNASQCRVADSVAMTEDTNHPKRSCLARGKDWIFLNETDHFAAGVHPAIRRIPEPTYQDVLRGKIARESATIEFEYPDMCGDRPCRSYPDNKMSDIAGSYNTEALAVVVEPDRSHTAYLLTKVHRSLAHLLTKQHPEAATCQFDTDGLSDVFRLRNIDTLPPGKVHQAEYITTVDFRDSAPSDLEDSPDRVTAANFLQLSDSQGLLLVRTTARAYKWPVLLASSARADGTKGAFFDVASALRGIKPLLASTPAIREEDGVGPRNQEAAAQLNESTIYYMGECKGLPRCGLAMVHDNHPYLPGDVDGNGTIDARDVDVLKAFVAGGQALFCKAAADVNGDNRITQEDVVYLEQYVAKQGPEPVPAAQGSQTTEHEALSCGYYNAALLPGMAP